MNRLQHYINRNRAEFDHYELPKNHHQRMESRLRNKSLHYKRRMWLLWATAAAACVVCICQLMVSTQTRHLSTKTTLVTDVLHYYNLQTTHLMDSICKIEKQNPSIRTNDLLNEANRLIGEKIEFETKEIPRLSPNEQALEVIYTFYTSTISGLELVLHLMEGRETAQVSP